MEVRRLNERNFGQDSLSFHSINFIQFSFPPSKREGEKGGEKDGKKPKQMVEERMIEKTMGNSRIKASKRRQGNN